MAPTSSVRHCLVTGGAGFIGSHLVDALLRQGCRVRVLDNLSTGSLDNLRHQMNRIEFIQGDIRDAELVKEACENIDYVFHLAALISVNQSMKEPLLTMDMNMQGTLNVLEGARHHGISRVAVASSAAVYGQATLPLLSEDAPVNPISPYGYSKLLTESYCQMYSHVYNLPTVCLRFFNVFGPRQRADSHYTGVISVFVNNMTQKKPLLIFGDGHQCRDFVHVSDIADALVTAGFDLDTPYDVFNVGTGTETSVLDIATWLKENCDNSIQLEYREERRGDPRRAIADTSKMKKALGFQATMAFPNGLQTVIEYTLSQVPSP